jgi:hypothetical protein
MANGVSFLDVATKRGVVDIAQQGAESLGTLANAIARQKTKEDKAAKEQLSQIAKMITPPKDMDKLVKEPAMQNYTATINKIYNSYRSGDPNWQTTAMGAFAEYSEDMASKQALSENFKAFNKARRNPNLFIPSDYKKLGEYYDGSNNTSEFVKKLEKDPVQGIDLDNLNITETTFKKKIPVQTYIASVYDDIQPIQLEKGGVTQIVSTEDEATNIQKTTGTRPNSIEKSSRRLIEDYDFLEQYIDSKGLDININNMGPAELKIVKDKLVQDGQDFVLKKYAGQGMTIKVNVKSGEQVTDTPYGFNKNIAFGTNKRTAQVKDSQGNTIQKEVTYYTPQFGNVKPVEQPAITITNLKGSVDRTGEPLKATVKKDAKLTGISIMPYKVEGGIDKGVFDSDNIIQATGFKMYYEFDGGDFYVPVSSMPNLQFNVGGKDEVKTKQSVLDQQAAFRKELNDYHLKVKNGTIKNPVLYTKIKEVKNGTITEDEFTNFIQNFKYDK